MNTQEDTTDSGLSQTQKAALALGDFERAGLPPLIYTDGGNGIRDAPGATAFPCALALAASFDRRLASQHGEALGREARAAGRNAVLGPVLDIARVPWGGRLGESFGEDPFLTGELGGIVGAAIQSQHVLAVAKHFVANNFEHSRTGRGSFLRRSDAIDVRMSPRALREIYAEPFRRALVHHGIAGLMGSYNRLNGEYVCESAAALSIPRLEWGFKGVLVPDFLFAVRDHRRALEVGLDLPGFDAPSGRTADMVGAAAPELVDDIAAHVLHALGAAHVAAAAAPRLPLFDPESLDVARDEIEGGAVLLKNEGNLLPLDPPAVGSIALPGVADPAHLLVMGGSAAVQLVPQRIPQLPATLAERLGADRVIFAPGTRGDLPLEPWKGEVRITVRDDVTGNEQFLATELVSLADPPSGIGPDWSATLECSFTPEITGAHDLVLTFAGEARLLVDGVLVADGFREASPMVEGPEYPLTARVPLALGVPVMLTVEYATGPAISIPGTPIRPGVRLGVGAGDDAFRSAVAASAEADVAVVVVGRVAGEAMDVESLELPGNQNALIEAVAATGCRTVVVVCSSVPTVMPWLDSVDAVLHLWNPGEQFAPALDRLLFGDAEPGGRLPLTFPATTSQTPASTPRRYPGIEGVAHYDEELLVGYRWFDAMGEEPAFAFGHGLGYTSFDISGLTATQADGSVAVEFALRNSGSRRGKAVPQLYSTSPDSAGHPPKSLRAFAALWLDAGEETRVRLTLPVDDLGAYDPTGGARTIHPGSYTLHAGFSSRDVRAAVRLKIPAPEIPAN